MLFSSNSCKGASDERLERSTGPGPVLFAKSPARPYIGVPPIVCRAILAVFPVFLLPEMVLLWSLNQLKQDLADLRIEKFKSGRRIGRHAQMTARSGLRTVHSTDGCKATVIPVSMEGEASRLRYTESTNALTRQVCRFTLIAELDVVFQPNRTRGDDPSDKQEDAAEAEALFL